MIELSILFLLGLFAVGLMVVFVLVGAAFKLTFGVLKLVLIPVGALVGLVLLAVVGPVLLAVVGPVLLAVTVVFFAVVVPVLVLAGLVWAGAHLVCSV